MKRLPVLTILLFLLGSITLKAQCRGTVNFDTAVMGNLNAINYDTFNITTSHPNELIIVSNDGYTSGNGNVTVDGNATTHIVTVYAVNTVASATYAYYAPAAGIHTIIADIGRVTGYSCAHAAAYYETTGFNSHIVDSLTYKEDTVQCLTGGSVTGNITTTVPNSLIYCDATVNEGSVTAYPISWTGATYINDVHAGNGIEVSYANTNAAVSGTYTVTAANSSPPNNGCGGLTLALIAIRPIYEGGSATISSTVDTNYCSGTATIHLSGGLAPYTYLWSNGQTTSTATGLCPGTYCCLFSDSGGCFHDTACVTVTGHCAIYTSSICYVTTDANSQHNVVVWQKADLDSNIVDSFFVYRKATNNSYAKIGQVSIHNFTEFIDTTSYPDVTSYFYELSIRDTCHDTAMSAYHQSVLLQSSLGIGHKVNLNWNFYQGVRVNYYRILRDDSGLGHWHVLDSVPSVINAYTDTAAPLNPGLQYRLSLNWNVSCSPYIPPHMLAHAAGRADIILPVLDESYSNISVAHPTGVQQLGLLSSSVDVYPNPTNNMLNVTVNGIQAQADFYLTDMLAQLVFSDKQKSVGEGFKEEINITSLPSGVYFLSIESNGQRLVKKVVKL